MKGANYKGVKMKVLLLMALLAMTPICGPNSVIPSYYVSKSPQIEYKVYDSRQIVVPKYYVKATPEGYRVYEAGKPLFPLYRLESKGGEAYWKNDLNERREGR